MTSLMPCDCVCECEQDMPEARGWAGKCDACQAGQHVEAVDHILELVHLPGGTAVVCRGCGMEQVREGPDDWTGAIIAAHRLEHPLAAYGLEPVL